MNEEPKAALPRRHVPDPELATLGGQTEARVSLGHAGNGLPTRATLDFALDHARARDAVYSSLDVDAIQAGLATRGRRAVELESAARTRKIYLTRPDLGRSLDPDQMKRLALGAPCDLVIVLADGLSAEAANINAVPLAHALLDRLEPSMSAAICIVRNGRVAIGDKIAIALRAKAVIVLIGERPGLSASDSLGAYLTWTPKETTTDAQRSCVSNIRDGGLPPTAAADQLLSLLRKSQQLGYSGIAPTRMVTD